MTDLYLLQDGTHAAPGDVSADKAGVLRHKNGLAVILNEDGTPQTVAKAAEENMNVAAAKVADPAAPPAETVHPAPREARPHAVGGQQSAADALGLKVGDQRPAATHEPKVG